MKISRPISLAPAVHVWQSLPRRFDLLEPIEEQPRRVPAAVEKRFPRRRRQRQRHSPVRAVKLQRLEVAGLGVEALRAGHPAPAAADDALDSWPSRPRLLASLTLWGVWAGVLLATLVPRPVGLTALRVAAPLGVVLALAAVPRSSPAAALAAALISNETGLADALGVSGGKGVLVTDVVADSPAASAGIRGGDVIVEVGGTAVDDVADLRRELRNHEGRVSITLVRRGARRTVEPDIGGRQQVMRWRDTDGDGYRDLIRRPDVRRRVAPDPGRGDLEEEMRQLREELRELRRKVEESERP